MAKLDDSLETLRMERDFIETLLDQVDEEVLVTDALGNILTANRKMFAAWGGTPGEYVGQNCHDLPHAKHAGEAGKRFMEMALQSDRPTKEHYTEVGPEGKARHYLVRVYPFRDANGTVRRVAITRADLTREIELQQRVQVAQKMATIGEMMAYVAHEIRNPLMSIGGFANSLSCEEGLADTTREKARIIREEAERLETILNTLSRYAKPVEIQPGAVDVNRVAQQAKDILTLNPEYRRPEILLNLSPSTCLARADQDKLLQCLINLVKNAHEAVDPDKGVIVVHTRYVDATVYLEVEDNGPGIPEHRQSALFTPYMTTKEMGTGLGLTITRKLLTEMGGRIFVHTKENMGSLFSMALPPALDLDEAALEDVEAALPPA